MIFDTLQKYIHATASIIWREFSNSCLFFKFSRLNINSQIALVIIYSYSLLVLSPTNLTGARILRVTYLITILFLHQPTNLRPINSGHINPFWQPLQINDFSSALAQHQLTHHVKYFNRFNVFIVFEHK